MNKTEDVVKAVMQIAQSETVRLEQPLVGEVLATLVSVYGPMNIRIDRPGNLSNELDIALTYGRPLYQMGDWPSQYTLTRARLLAGGDSHEE